jgi:hypothetical protein
LDKNHKPLEILFITHLLPTHLFFGFRGVGIHNVISKNYHMSDVTLISRKICDKMLYRMVLDPEICELERGGGLAENGSTNV